MAPVHAQASCRLYAVIEAGAAALATLEAALAAGDVAVLLIAPVAGAGVIDSGIARSLVIAAQRAGTAALVDSDAEFARSIGADGVHIRGADDPIDAYRIARNVLGPRGIVGVDAGISRHDAMTLAEAGADYIAFGAPAHLTDTEKARARRDELVAWWGEIFEIPCVAFDVDTPAQAGDLSAAGADFLAVRVPVGQPPAEVRDRIAAMAAAIRAPATAG